MPGDIVDQLAVPILQDDEAREVFAKVTVAAETILARSLPGLIAGTAARRPQTLEAGQYFGRRRPEDGRIDWGRPALEIHNLVRAVAPPFPGAFAEVADGALGDPPHAPERRAGGRRRRATAARGRRGMPRGVRRRRAAAPAERRHGRRAARSGGAVTGARAAAAAAGVKRWRSWHSRSTSTPTAVRARACCAWRTCWNGSTRARPSCSAWGLITPGAPSRRAFRRGFLGKVKRTSVLQHYGLRTLMYGMLLPGPHIGRRCREPMRDIAQRGFEVGVHTWDHVKLAGRSRAGERGVDAARAAAGAR